VIHAFIVMVAWITGLVIFVQILRSRPRTIPPPLPDNPSIGLICNQRDKINQLEDRLAAVAVNKELDNRVLLDAVERGERLEAALRGTLKSIGASDTQIEEVLRSVEK
jgi:hypothetical protein